MFPTSMLTTALLAFLYVSLASAQLLAQGLPTCAQSCPTLIQASTACGGLQSANQAIWGCFCQSAYLKNLYSSAVGICDSVCTDPTQNQQVVSWYQGNCGSDNGASEHANDGSGQQTTLVITSTSTSATPSASSAATQGAAATSSSGSNAQTATRKRPEEGSWWGNHWKWIVMVIVLAIALSLIAILATWLKKRRDRKGDEPNTSFNEGITTRTAPSDPKLGHPEKLEASGSLPPAAPALHASPSGRNSPIRTREAFMPYGYNYTRSESRLASGASASNDAIEQISTPPPVVATGPLASGRSSPLARGATPVGHLERGGVEGTPIPPGQIKRKKVLVRERSVEDDAGTPPKTLGGGKL